MIAHRRRPARDRRTAPRPSAPGDHLLTAATTADGDRSPGLPSLERPDTRYRQARHAPGPDAAPQQRHTTLGTTYGAGSPMS